MVPSSDYLGAVRALCTERGALLMLDEVQTGLGRTGHWFAFQAQGLEPDVVTMAKALGNGMPVGACWARAEVAAAFGPGDHGSTFGGQPLALAAAKATLAVMEDEDVCGRAREGGADWPRVCGAARGRLGARRRSCCWPHNSRRPVAREVAPGSGARPAGQPRAARRRASRPPLLVSDDEIDKALRILGESLAACAGRRRRATVGEWTGHAEPPRHRRPLPGRLGPGAGARPRPAPATLAGQGWRCSSRSPRPGRATPPRWRSSTWADTPSTSRPPRSASTFASRPRTWHGTLGCYHRILCARVFDHGVLGRMVARARTAAVSTSRS